MNTRFFTSKSVTEGHMDKLFDTIFPTINEANTSLVADKTTVFGQLHENIKYRQTHWQR